MSNTIKESIGAPSQGIREALLKRILILDGYGNNVAAL
jgi:hypothetical protein